MKIILVDAINAFVIEGKGIFNEMYKILGNIQIEKLF